MLVVISPAKKLSVEGKKPDWFTAPQFIEHSEKLIKKLRKYSPKKLQQLMSISDDLAQLNVERYQQWTINHDTENTKQALFTFTGEVYAGLNATSFKKNELEYAQQHLRILSGLYGVLKPMDAIHAYRLEMGTKLKIGKKSNLYEFWGDTIVNEINNTLKANNDKVLVNLASNEYFKAVNKKKLATPVITPVFKDFTNGQYKTVMVYAKKARGAMAAFIMKNKIKTIEELTAFDTDGYLFNEEASSSKELVFLRN
ncbi:MAG TPA: peroxide stress protein YaaA [Vicingaceae bacterium]